MTGRILPLVLALAALSAHGQRFEVASIKPADPMANGRSTHTSQGQLRMENQSLKDLIQRAFDLKDYSFSGPGWLDSARFDIVAKPPAGASPKQYNAMLQALLAERFKLEYHRESKVMPAYALVVDKKGLKVKPVEDKQQSGWSTGRNRIEGHQLTMAGFADLLAGQLDHPVEDMTQVSGVYDIKLLFVKDESPAEPPADSGLASSIFAALQEQAGLRLETRKLPVQILVVDRIERTPTEN
jgi:uncharacterized protein (TIGR03435 family)